MKTKRIIGILLTLTMIIGLLPITASAAEQDYTVDISSSDITLTETDGVKYANGTAYEGELTVTDSDTTIANVLTIESGEHNVTIDSVTAKQIKVATGAKLNLTLTGESTVTPSGDDLAAIHVPEGAELVITESSQGSVSATGGSKGAGIGGGYSESSGKITICGGTVNATGGDSGAGIGGGYNASGGTITVYDGDITATGGTGTANVGGAGAGIGGGASNASSATAIVSGGTITINGGTVTATGGDSIGTVGSGAGIGGGGGGRNTFAGTCGNVTINGGTVTATAGTANDNSYVGFGIGRGGYSRIEINSGSITINGGNVNASNVFPLPKDADGNSLMLVAITLEGAYDIDGLKMLLDSEGNLIDYRVSNAMLPDGKLYVYLPNTSAPSLKSAVVGRYEYILNGDWSGDETKGYSATFMDNGLYNCDHRYSAKPYSYTVHDDAHSFECSVCDDTITEDHSTASDGDKVANCSSKAYCSVCDSEYGYVDKTNHDSNIDFDSDGFCKNGCYEPATDSDSDGVYEIASAGQLFWFANHVNTVDRTASAVLVADIDLENRPWTPIGSTGENSNNFRGHFDGRNHTITNLYIDETRAGLGFFGEVRLGTVENFTIYGDVKLYGDCSYVGGVIGSAPGANGTDVPDHNGATIRNITSYVDVTLVENAHGSSYVGGFIGYANHETIIENCSWYGTLDLGAYRADSGVGGLVGRLYDKSNVTIRNCGAYGTIKTSYKSGTYQNYDTIYIGGVLSFSPAGTQAVLENNLWAGNFINDTDLGNKAHLSAFGTLNGEEVVTNCYTIDSVPYLTTENVNANGITTVTMQQLASGEVAYLLQGEQTTEVWGQDLTKENSVPVLGSEKVCLSNGIYYNEVKEFEILSNGTDGAKATATVAIPTAGTYTLVFADYEEATLNDMDFVTVTAESDNTVVTVPSEVDITLGKDDKIMLWQDMTNLVPLCKAYIVK